MNSKRIHIVAFDIPYPADYGGVIDIYYKMKALHALGCEIILHMYQYGREKSDKELKKYCKQVFYYKRRTFKNPFIGSLPYIVNSRDSEELLVNLNKDNSPIVFEGLHCTFHLADKSLAKRCKVVRTHNIEHHYYKHLEKSESRYFKKYFFRIEAEKLRKYEKVLKEADYVAAISLKDELYFNKKYGNTIYLPAFHSNDTMDYPGRRGKYLLYHGNLAVPENYVAATELVKNVFSKISTKSVIAGNNPPKELILLCEKYPNIELRTNLTTEEIHQLISEAHINVLHTNQNTGIKLKLLNALYRGKFAIVNSLMVDGSGLEDVCVVSTSFDQMVKQVEEYVLLDYSEAYFSKRKSYIVQHFSNLQGAKTLIGILDFPEKTKANRKKDTGMLDGLSQLSSFMSYFSM